MNYDADEKGKGTGSAVDTVSKKNVMIVNMLKTWVGFGSASTWKVGS